MYDSFWTPGDRVYYRLNEVCGFCEGLGVITGKNGQTVTCPVCNGETMGEDAQTIGIIDYIVINNTGVWYHMENGDIIAQGQLINRVEESEDIVNEV